MKKPASKKSVSIPRIEKDLKSILQSGDAFSLPTEEDEEPPQIDLEGAMKLFDSLRARERATEPATRERRWTHPSVLALSPVDPIAAIIRRAREMVLDGMERGWSGPPYNPLSLAEMNGIKLVPSQSVLDARTLSDSRQTFTIEFNPLRPPARVHYSIAHELGHTLFHDCASAIRNRATHEEMKEDDWQLETLCNLAAAEILMPIGTLQDELTQPLSIGMVLDLRQKYLVSCEAIVNRFVKLTAAPSLAFFARRDTLTQQYSVEYLLKSRTLTACPLQIYRGSKVPRTSKLLGCTTIGMSEREDATWISTEDSSWYAEYLAVSPNAGELYPRILCLASPSTLADAPKSELLGYRRGDASEPVGTGSKLLLQLVNDRAQTWGGGFAHQIRRKWPQAQASFREWALNRDNLRLGNIHTVEIRSDLTLVSLIAQHGFGATTAGPRVRYGALFSALEKVADLALAKSASVHLPRIGTGGAGGSWMTVEGILRETLIGRNLSATIYDIGAPKGNAPSQGNLEIPNDITDEMI